ncbi:polyketide synthase, partial [Frankia sp. Cas3]|uniref:polyketide synthase n=1 Tax=Frankia sp. Cas3 TaxID=3073926 RepID=UPI002AD2B86F
MVHPTRAGVILGMENSVFADNGQPVGPGFRGGPAEPIAVVGMACRFPGAPSVRAFWRVLRDGREVITDVPASRWNAAELFDPDPTAPGKVNSTRGGFIDGIDLFDAPFFHVSPREAAFMDPRQRLVLEIGWEALEDGGVIPETVRGRRLGIFVGSIWDDF